MRGVTDDAKRAALRAKWRRQKAAQLLRRPKVTAPRPPGEMFVRLVLAERDYRLKRERDSWGQPEVWDYAYRWALLAPAADLWAAKVVLEKQFGPGGAKPKRILDWMMERGMTHRCTRESLRVVIWRAGGKLKWLESQFYLNDRHQPLWPPFSIAEAAERAKLRIGRRHPNHSVR